MLRYDDESVLTGSSDGLIRILSIQPNMMLGVLGEHAGELFSKPLLSLWSQCVCVCVRVQ